LASPAVPRPTTAKQGCTTGENGAVPVNNAASNNGYNNNGYGGQGLWGLVGLIGLFGLFRAVQVAAVISARKSNVIK
jgi:hypothetical protein